MTKPTKPAAVDGPTLDDAADAQLFSSKTFAWVEYTPLAVQYMADSNDYVDLVAAAVDADAMATEAGRAQAVLKAGEAAASAGEAADSETQAGLYASAAAGSAEIDVSSNSFGDHFQVVDVGAGVKGLAISHKRVDKTAAATGTSYTLAQTDGVSLYHTLTATTNLLDGLVEGESVVYKVDDGAGFGLNHPAGTVWLTDGGSAPTLKPTGYTPILYEKTNGVLYGTRCGDGG